MRKILFFVNYYKLKPEVGTTKRIEAEIYVLRKLGYEVYYTAYLDETVGVFDNEDELVCEQKYSFKTGIVKRYNQRNDLCKIAYKFLDKKNMDICIMRLNALNFYYRKLLKKMASSQMIRVMIITNFFTNIRYSDMSAREIPIIYSLHKYGSKIKDWIDLALNEDNSKEFYDVPCMRLSPGIIVENTVPHEFEGDKEELHLIMVGCTSIYHGVDRIIKSLKVYYDSLYNRKVFIHLVGDVNDSDIKLIEKNHLSDYVIFHGFKSGKELDDVYNMANVAMGPLAQYVSKKKDNGLKTKEYMAKGIPYISVLEEEGVPNDFKYIYYAANDDSIIDINDVLSFYDKVKNDSNLVFNMRKMATEQFNWETKYKKVMVEVERLLSKNL